MKYWHKIRGWLPHIVIVLGGMYIVFFFIDKVNAAMAFINNDLTKFLLFVHSILSIYLCTRVIHYDRLVERQKKAKRAKKQSDQR